MHDSARGRDRGTDVAGTEQADDDQSAEQDSFAEGILDHPHYTRPSEYKGWKVPDVLLSGNHKAIEEWRKETALATTRQRRPDLINPTAA